MVEGDSGRQRGQASVELIAAVPALLLAALVCLQLMVAGYSLTLADGAAEAGALALASGAPAEDAARAALPGWAKEAVQISSENGAVSIELRPPVVVPGLGDLLTVSSQAYVRQPG